MRTPAIADLWTRFAASIGAPDPRTNILQDVGAGVCVAGLLLPEAVAYAGLAHLPTVHALSALLVGLSLYALFGNSRFAIVSPTSSTAALSAAAVVSLSLGTSALSPAAYAASLMAMVLVAGVILMLLALTRQGQLSAFVSRPVLRGFAFALAVTIVIKQLPDALGLTVPSAAAGDPLHVLLYVVTNVRQWHLPTVAVAASAGAGVILLKRWPQLPASMLVIVAAMAAAYGLDLQATGVQEVGTIERPSWQIGLPDLALADWMRIGELAFGLVVLIFAESWGSIRSMALAHGDSVDANRELLVLGACNVTAALMQGMPVGAGFSASSANAAAGATSRWAGVVALIVIAAALAFALPALRLLPRPVLAVAVISALWHALNPRPLLEVWRMNRDRVLIVAAVAAVLFFGVLHGMLIAIALSMLAALRRFSLPVVHELGELGNTRNFVVIDDHPGTQALPKVLILRPEEPLFFASAERVVAEILSRVASRPQVQTVIVSLEESADLDSTALECLLELDRRLFQQGKSLVLSRAKEVVRDLLQRWDPHGIGSSNRLYWSVADAVRYSQTPG